MTFQQKLSIVAALAALCGLVIVLRMPLAESSFHPAKLRSRSSVGTYLVVIAAALILVGVVSQTVIRHLVQIAPLVLALALLFRSEWGIAAAMPLFAFWLLVMGAIWLFLLGIARIFTGTFSPTEITLTLVIGAASVAGLAVAYRRRTSIAVATRLGIVVLFAILQFGAMWLSVQPFVARRY